MSRILVLQGHPDPACGHLCHVLADAYAAAARAAGHQVDIVAPAALEFPLLANAREWEEGELPPPGFALGMDAAAVESWRRRMRALGGKAL